MRWLKQHLDRGPGEGVLLRAGLGVGVHQAAAALDEVDLGGGDARMLVDAEDVGEPEQRRAPRPARP